MKIEKRKIKREKNKKERISDPPKTKVRVLERTEKRFLRKTRGEKAERREIEGVDFGGNKYWEIYE